MVNTHIMISILVHMFFWGVKLMNSHWVFLMGFFQVFMASVSVCILGLT